MLEHDPSSSNHRRSAVQPTVLDKKLCILTGRGRAYNSPETCATSDRRRPRRGRRRLRGRAGRPTSDARL